MRRSTLTGKIHIVKALMKSSMDHSRRFNGGSGRVFSEAKRQLRSEGYIIKYHREADSYSMTRDRQMYMKF